MKFLAFICARGGSVGFKNKNITPICGKPLIAWSIEQALQSKYIDNIHVSTDSTDVADLARSYGAEIPFIRPAHLATSSAGKFEVFRHALMTCETLYNESFDYYVDLDCTNPLRSTSDIDNLVELLISSPSYVDGAFTICEARKNPYFNLLEANKEGFLKVSKALEEPIIRRQDSPVVYEHVASTYAFKAKYVKEASNLLDGNLVGYDIGQDKSFDVDSKFDFELIEFLLGKNNQNTP